MEAKPTLLSESEAATVNIHRLKHLATTATAAPNTTVFV